MQTHIGARVRLKQDIVIEDDPFMKAMRKGQVPGFEVSKDLQSRTVIPKGSEGVVSEGSPYNSGIFNFDVETPVNFDMFSKGKGVEGFDKQYALGVQDELLEVVQEKVRLAPAR